MTWVECMWNNLATKGFKLSNIAWADAQLPLATSVKVKIGKIMMSCICFVLAETGMFRTLCTLFLLVQVEVSKVRNAALRSFSPTAWQK